ncbi:hypothetical protein GOP47_0018166 [Adiantum capillus-veneris]|uniref:F-box domain-containing protein n=1 Tax=Adiantum capillus-veneris TaxID=13818 RepID=A0A9D4UHQ8_ADICA|nr:hypothetical protein GOP47_0018166 [Adiantum capillus-veneris]
MESSAVAILEGLPEDVMRVVLSHVPSPWVVQARVVSKQWRRILSCTHFARQWAARAHATSPHHSLCLLLNYHNHGDEGLSALHLPTHLCLPALLPPASRPLAASPLGLLLCRSSSSGTFLSLFQPLTHASTPLPPPPHINTPLSAALSTTSPAGHFFLLALGTPLNSPLILTTPFVAEIYSSVSSSWTPLPPLPHLRNPTLIPRCTSSLVWWKEAFFMLWGNCILTFKPSQAEAATATTEETATWGSIELPKEPRIWDARFLTLHVIKGRLFVEGNFQEQGDFQRRNPLRIGVVELADPRKQLWKEASFMPDSLSMRLCSRQQHPAHCFYTTYSDPLSDHVYFTPYVDTGSASDNELSIEVVLFDVSSGSWSSMSNVAASPALFSSPTFRGPYIWRTSNFQC